MTAGKEGAVLARAVFEAYSRNGGNPPDAHFDRNAAEQWMAQALEEVGVAELIEVGAKVAAHDYTFMPGTQWSDMRAFRAALAAINEQQQPTTETTK